MGLIDTDKLPHYDGTALSAVAVARAVENAPTIDIESLIIQHEDIGYERGYRDGYAEAVEANDGEEFEWCTDCKEYDQNAHCCHRWTKVIRTTVNDLKTQGYEPVKYGEWTLDRTGAEYCSECGKYPFDDGEYRIAGWHSDYCPHCGAKMDVPDTNIGKMDEGYPNALDALDALEDEDEEV